MINKLLTAINTYKSADAEILSCIDSLDGQPLTITTKTRVRIVGFLVSADADYLTLSSHCGIGHSGIVEPPGQRDDIYVRIDDIRTVSCKDVSS